MQVRFNHDKCFIENGDNVNAGGHKEWQMFMLDTNDVGPLYIPRDRKLNHISSCGTSSSATSTSWNSKTCNESKLYSIYRNLVAKKAKLVKHVSLERNIGIRFPMSAIGVATSCRIFDWPQAILKHKRERRNIEFNTEIEAPTQRHKMLTWKTLYVLKSDPSWVRILSWSPK